MKHTVSTRRIGLLIDSMIGGGAERVVLNFHSIFTQLGHDVHIILVKNEIHHSVAHIPASNIHSISEDGLLSHTRFINKLKLAQRLNHVVKQIENDGTKFSFFLSNAEDMDRITKIAKLPNVYIRYRNSMSKYIEGKIGNKGPVKSLIRRLRFTNKFRNIYGGRNIITVSQALADDIVKNVGVKPKSITTIYNPFNFERLRKLAAEPADIPKEPYIMYSAKFENRKRHDLLIEAFHKANVKHKLVLIGDCYTESDHETYKKLLEQINRLGLKNRIIFPGFQKNPYPWVKNAVLFAMSSDSEGLPTVLIESLILGTPVVSTDCSTGPKEILTGELSSFLSPPGDAVALAENIKRALKHYSEIPSSILDKFDDSSVAKQYLEHCAK
jgi:glycosyltransferase involved in cell wall biosynthesis